MFLNKLTDEQLKEILRLNRKHEMFLNRRHG